MPSVTRRERTPYPEILRRYQGVEVSDVPDRTYAMVGGNYFDLVDITERIDAAFDRLVPPDSEGLQAVD